jgi:hypothetical protein
MKSFENVEKDEVERKLLRNIGKSQVIYQSKAQIQQAMEK